MAFFVPERYEGFYEETVQRFKLLLQKQVLTGIDLNSLNQWLSNFQTKEEKYLAAHLLNCLVYRSGNMMCSSYQHLVHCELPAFLQRHGMAMQDGLEAFHEALQQADAAYPLRFVAVDGGFEQVPGKSGAVIIRQFKRHLNVNKLILCRPENMAALPATVRYLVFVDDLLGTGKQFNKFADFYKLNELRARFTMAYSPQLSHTKGTGHLAEKFPWLTVLPIEQLGVEHQFFRLAKDSATLWHGDKENLAGDVKAFCNALAEKGEIPKTTQYSLELTILFEHAAPNNTLPFYWATSNRWRPLIPR